jgi:periplasmic divalent cation tolerance protein
MEYRAVYITASDESEARKIGQTIVSEKLAACVNYFPINSVYRWQGNMEECAEIAIIAKTRVELVDRLIQRVKELHSYKTPCIVSWVIEKGNPDFLAWISQSTE